jgi:NADPH-dependent glutamate synthase beta subunit-like oxidoreductase
VTANHPSAAPRGWSDPSRTTLEISTGAWRTRRPVYVEATAPCRPACPAGEPIARWIERLREGDHAGAWDLLRAENPFPAITGRVCGHPCERACNRQVADTPVAINALERFLGDWGLAHGAPVDVPVTRRERIAVVGGGPAGLAAATHLARSGYPVTVFEAQPHLGGLLRYGIPEYRLPRAVLERELDLALPRSVQVLAGRRLGDDLSWRDLAGYDGLFVATGAALPLGLGVPGESLRGIADGLEFLRSVRVGTPRPLGARVVVIGGGSSAMDVARSARRLGARRVTVLAVEARADMPALADEVAQALAEDVEIVNGVGIASFVDVAGVVSGVVTAPARLRVSDDGVVRVALQSGPRYVVSADDVLLAIGQAVDLNVLDPSLRRERGVVVVAVDGATSVPRVFAGGDVASRQRTVADAIGAGTRAARAIHAALGGAAPVAAPAGLHAWAEARPAHVVAPGQLNVDHLVPGRRAARRERLPDARVASFDEVVNGLDEADARAEAARCATCGHCIGCDNCRVFCPDIAVARVGNEYRIDAAHCKGCGLCVAECPRGAMAMVEES